MTQTENGYTIGGLDPLELCDKYELPLFVYDSAKITSQYNALKDAFSIENLKINFACKALTNISILKLMKNLGAGLDAVSIQEVELGLRAGFKPEDILFTANSVSIQEIEKAIDYNVKINIDNIEFLEYLGHKYTNLPLCIRINPHVMAGGNRNISVGHIDSKFGISIHQMPLVERLVEALKLNIVGIHMHTGSDILDVDVFMYAAEILFNTARKFENLQYIDFGSGFKVRYKDNDYETDIALFGKEMSAQFNEFCAETGKQPTLMFEPGKYLVSESGYFFAKTNQIKQTTSTIFACLDTGFNHIIRPMFYNSYHRIINISNPKGMPKIYTVVGYICETDTFGWNRKINEIHRDDILCFFNAGAYCYTMSSNYNSRYRPAEVLIHEGKDYLITKRETMEDLLRNQVQPEIFNG
ncbi:MAG: lysA [Ignavibacteria bacterium]|nr:lysA [Ignavibacteria bacterium]